jgi:hypothetical protein
MKSNIPVHGGVALKEHSTEQRSDYSISHAPGPAPLGVFSRWARWKREGIRPVRPAIAEPWSAVELGSVINGCLMAGRTDHCPEKLGWSDVDAKFAGIAIDLVNPSFSVFVNVVATNDI